uniref:Light-independent protochlorophyllide reductase subunit B n=1 Tax=Phacotus lenticularis TaxID=52965 RepID=A0A0S2LQ25_9CHLO|nr:ChlB subunit of protochlorophyllide reductase [Phacotus lenticularis]ALO63573.1 ChlB subunit of protochlorophyllide reductase [Phacotus lenticularis]
MKLAYWMYAGPAHIGTLRVASSFKNVHAIMHAPLGDDYFNVMRSMLERERDFTPVTASIVDRHVLARGSQEKVVENITRKDKEENPDLILLTPTCTSSILQEDLQNFVDRAILSSKSDVILADVNHYRVNEFQAADRTLEQIVRFYLEKAKKENLNLDTKTLKPSANILGVFTLGFHNQHDCRELRRLLNDLGIDVNEVIPEGGEVSNLKNLPKAWFNFVPYREVGLMTAIYLQKEFNMPYVATTPMGLVDTATCIREIQKILNSYILNGSTSLPSSEELGKAKTNNLSNSNEMTNSLKLWNFESYIEDQTRYLSQAAWFSRSIDCQNLTGKKTVVFGDATHAAAMTKILAREMGIRVACAGTYCRHDADWFREQVVGFCDQVLITDDHTQVGDMIAKLEPSAIFGTQMERHVGKRLDIPCGVISAPVHIQNFPLGYRPFLGYEGSNQIADLVYNSFNLGMEEHLLTIFGGHDSKAFISKSLSTENIINWSNEAQVELQKVPGFVRNKVKIKTENYALSQKMNLITVEVMYAAKEAVGS